MSLEGIYKLDLTHIGLHKNLLPIITELQTSPLISRELLAQMESGKGTLEEWISLELSPWEPPSLLGAC